MDLYSDHAGQSGEGIFGETLLSTKAHALEILAAATQLNRSVVSVQERIRFVDHNVVERHRVMTRVCHEADGGAHIVPLCLFKRRAHRLLGLVDGNNNRVPFLDWHSEQLVINAGLSETLDLVVLQCVERHPTDLENVTAARDLIRAIINRGNPLERPEVNRILQARKRAPNDEKFDLTWRESFADLIEPLYPLAEFFASTQVLMVRSTGSSMVETYILRYIEPAEFESIIRTGSPVRSIKIDTLAATAASSYLITIEMPHELLLHNIEMTQEGGKLAEYAIGGFARRPVVAIRCGDEPPTKCEISGRVAPRATGQLRAAPVLLAASAVIFLVAALTLPGSSTLSRTGDSFVVLILPVSAVFFSGPAKHPLSTALIFRHRVQIWALMLMSIIVSLIILSRANSSVVAAVCGFGSFAYISNCLFRYRGLKALRMLEDGERRRTGLEIDHG